MTRFLRFDAIHIINFSLSDVLVFDYYGCDAKSIEEWAREFIRSAQTSRLPELWKKHKSKIHNLRKQYVPLSELSFKSWKKDEKTREAIRVKHSKH